MPGTLREIQRPTSHTALDGVLFIPRGESGVQENVYESIRLSMPTSGSNELACRVRAAGLHLRWHYRVSARTRMVEHRGRTRPHVSSIPAKCQRLWRPGRIGGSAIPV